MDCTDVSPADFGHTKELIDWGHRSSKRYLAGGNGRGVLTEPARKTLNLNPSPARAA